MDRNEHLQWAKDRALAYMPDTGDAAVSFLSDLTKHPELSDHPVRELIGMHMFAGLLNERNCRDLIEGTN